MQPAKPASERDARSDANRRDICKIGAKPTSGAKSEPRIKRGGEKTAQFAGQELFVWRRHTAREEQFVHLLLDFARFGGAVGFELAVAEALERLTLAAGMLENLPLHFVLLHQLGDLLLHQHAELPLPVGAERGELQLRRGHSLGKQARHVSPIFARGSVHRFDLMPKPLDFRGEPFEAQPLESFAARPHAQHRIQ